MIKALIFDFDGTILDTELPDYESWQDVYREHGCELSLEDWSRCVGTTYESFNPFDDLAVKSGSVLDRATIDQKHKERFYDRVARQIVREGVVEVIEEAKRLGLKVGLASSASRQWVVSHLERLGILHEFGCLLTSEDVSRVKPDPELYIAALRALGVSANEAIAFEDSPNGVRAAKSAGIFAVAIPNAVTCQLPLDHADMTLTALSTEALGRLLKQVGND